MIEYVRGDIFASEAQALVNPVNTDGVMSKGLAAQFKRSFPANYTAYNRACADGDVAVGRMFITQTDDGRYIVNFPTKQGAKDPSKLEYIEEGLVDLAKVVTELGITSIAVPGLGSGLGGLNWSDVRPHIESALENFPELTAYVYEPLPD